MNNFYIITDTHFSHAKMINENIRPADYEERIAKGLSKLTEDDTLIHLGDICMGKDAYVHEKYIKPLKCKKILIKGNHDGKSVSWYLNHGWDWVCKQMYDVYFGERILFSHVPKPKQDRYDFNIHGHLHEGIHRHSEVSEFYNKKFNKLIALENDGYNPISLKSFIEKLK